VKPGGRGRAHRTSGTAVENCKGASDSERSTRSQRGAKLRRENPTGGSGTKQGREARTCQETAERLRKPGSGTAARRDGSLHDGASPGDVVEGAKNLEGAGSGGQRPDRREDVKTLEGIDSKGV
jgi:hypothetical protein